jgi:hypothetical protein
MDNTTEIGLSSEQLITQAQKNAEIAVNKARKVYYSTTSTAEEREKEALIVKRSVDKFRKTIVSVRGKSIFKKTEWTDLGPTQSIENNPNTIFYLPKTGELIQAPKLLVRDPKSGFDISKPDIEKSSKTSMNEWTIKGKMIIDTLANFYQSTPQQASFKL